MPSLPDLSEYSDVLPQGTIDAWPAVAAVLPEVNGYLQHLLDFRHLEDDPAITAAFGDGIRDRVEQHFRSRQPEVIAAFHQHLTGSD